jgi:hypothetical protein
MFVLCFDNAARHLLLPTWLECHLAASDAIDRTCSACHVTFARSAEMAVQGHLAATAGVAGDEENGGERAHVRSLRAALLVVEKRIWKGEGRR